MSFPCANPRGFDIIAVILQHSHGYGREEHQRKEAMSHSYSTENRRGSQGHHSREALSHSHSTEINKNNIFSDRPVRLMKQQARTSHTGPRRLYVQNNQSR